MKTTRIIEKLRKLYPGQQWKYDATGFRWIGTEFDVYGESSNYDDCTGMHTVQYRRNDTFELLVSLGSRREYCG